MKKENDCEKELVLQRGLVGYVCGFKKNLKLIEHSKLTIFH